jgi:hypothetical protein
MYFSQAFLALPSLALIMIISKTKINLMSLSLRDSAYVQTTIIKGNTFDDLSRRSITWRGLIQENTITENKN